MIEETHTIYIGYEKNKPPTVVRYNSKKSILQKSIHNIYLRFLYGWNILIYDDIIR
jgi:hypothetical protein